MHMISTALKVPCVWFWKPSVRFPLRSTPQSEPITLRVRVAVHAHAAV